MEVVKEFVVKGYADANFDTNLDTYSGATIWNSSKWSVEAAFTI